MNTQELALVVFTVLAQMSVGAFVILRVAHWYARRKAGLVEADRLCALALLAVWPVLGLGLVASLFHLGNPLNAFNTVRNAGSSWLSREILCGILFAAAGVAFAMMELCKIGAAALRSIAALVVAVIGLALVYSMANVYLLRTVPVWNTAATPISFFVTTFLLGGLSVGAALMVNYLVVQRDSSSGADAQGALLREVLKGIALLSTILLGIEFVVLPMQAAHLAAGGGAASASASLMIGRYGVVFLLRLALVFAGAAVVGLVIYETAQRTGREELLARLTYGAFAMVLVGEVLGRYLFYVTYARIGV